MTDDDTDELARITEDAEAFVDKARLRSLFDARDTAAEAIQEATLTKHRLAAERSAAESEQLVDEHVRAAVTTYVLECEPLLQNTSTGLQYWQSYEVGPVHLPPYPPSDTAWEMEPDRTVVGVPAGLIDAERDVIEIPGIRQYVNLPSPIRLRWSGIVESAGFNRGTEDGAETTKISMPRDASEDVFRGINKLLADLGVGLDAETIEDDEASYDYSDLL